MEFEDKIKNKIMANKPINRQNRDDLLKQIGRVEIEIRELGRKQSSFQKEIDRVPKIIEHFETRKIKIQEQISKKQLYLNQLENDIKKLIIDVVVPEDTLCEHTGDEILHQGDELGRCSSVSRTT